MESTIVDSNAFIFFFETVCIYASSTYWYLLGTYMRQTIHNIEKIIELLLKKS